MNDDRTPGSGALQTHPSDATPHQMTAALPDISQTLQDAVASSAIPGAVAVITDAKQEVFRGAFGYADHARSRTFAQDDLFRIASAVKLWTSMLLMQLVEQNIVTLDDPLGRYLPEFDELPVLVGFAGDEPVLVDPLRSPTIREVCAHLGGLSYPFSSDLNARYGQVVDVPRGWGVLGALTQLPRIAQPGQKVVYGTGFDWIGLLIERVTGDKLEDRFRAKLFDPIGMNNTFHRLDPSAARRVVPVLSLDARNEWTLSQLGFDYAENPEFCQGGGHLYTTASDYAKLMRVLLSGGQSPGGRILSPASVDRLFEPLVPHSRIEILRTVVPIITADVDLGVGDRWGLGMMINDDDVAGRRRAASGGWAGIWNTFFWVDRISGIAGALFMQYLPFCDSGAVQTFDRFERSAYAHFGRPRDSADELLQCRQP